MVFTLVNMNQSPEQRRAKYRIIRAFGKNYSWARTMRDWRLNNIAKHFGFQNSKAMLAALPQAASANSSTTE